MIEAPDDTSAPVDALDAAQHDRAVARTRGDVEAEAVALVRIAALARGAGRLDDALTAAIEARELARITGCTVAEVRALHLEGQVHADVGNLDDALDSVVTALDLARRAEHPDATDEQALLCTLSGVHLARGDVDRALEVAEAAVGLAADDVDALVTFTRARIAAGDLTQAVGSGEAALRLARDAYPDWVGEILLELAAADVSLGRLDRAADRLDEADGMAGAADVALGRAAVSSACGHHDDAVRHAGEALVAIDDVLGAGAPPVVRLGALRRRAQAHLIAAIGCRAEGRLDEAILHHEQRVAAVEELAELTVRQRMLAQQIAHDAEAGRQQAEILRLRTGELEALVRGRTYDLEEYQLEAFQRLAILAEFRDTDTGEHTIRVGDLAGEIAEELGEAPPWSHRLRLAARLHDIGKVAVPDAILLKPGKLTDDEMAVMRTHTTVGAEILGGSVSPLIQLAAEVALNHHEWWDGRGYPNGAAGEVIPLSGRIVSVADVFDALLSARPYKRAWTTAEAAQYIVDGSGAQFEPRVVDAFVRVALRRHPELALELTLSA